MSEIDIKILTHIYIPYPYVYPDSRALTLIKLVNTNPALKTITPKLTTN